MISKVAAYVHTLTRAVSILTSLRRRVRALKIGPDALNPHRIKYKPLTR